MGGVGVQTIAFYLPQFHPIPENDEWWGPGFTEWRNVAAAKPLYRGHHQPNLPGELGFYDLRVPETRAAQASLATAYGVTAFCYWHYWFAGKQILNRPLEDVVESGEPDFPFCLGWANESWSGVWHGAPNRILIEQTYPGRDDHVAHFEWMLPLLHDVRYFRVCGKPLLYIHKPLSLPDAESVIDLWRERAVIGGLPGLHVVAQSRQCTKLEGFDGTVVTRVPNQVRSRKDWRRPAERLLRRPTIRRFADEQERFLASCEQHAFCYPCLVPGWDNTPRCGRRGQVLEGATPELFRLQVRAALDLVADRPPQDRLIFIKSWNEWAEGNYLEPDLRFGRGFLECLADELRSAEGVDRGSTDTT